MGSLLGFVSTQSCSEHAELRKRSNGQAGQSCGQPEPDRGGSEGSAPSAGLKEKGKMQKERDDEA
jgi:hypothetical protein